MTPALALMPHQPWPLLIFVAQPDTVDGLA